MSIVKNLGELALATRLKMISDYLYNQVDEAYKQKGLNFQARWFLFIHLLYERAPLAMNEIAEELGQTHSAISQLSKKLEKEGLIKVDIDKSDERRRLLSLTKKAIDLYNSVRPICFAVEKSITKYIVDSDSDLLNSIEAFEDELSKSELHIDAIKRLDIATQGHVEIVEFDEKYRDDFKRLNIEWLEKYFYVEEFDNEVLSNPEKYIIDMGGYIFFAKLNDEIVGTCALMKDKDDFWELTKMAVSENYQGLKIGQKIAVAVINKFKSFSKGTLFLESNSKLKPALALYEKLGFALQEKTKSGSHYKRANVYMLYQP